MVRGPLYLFKHSFGSGYRLPQLCRRGWPDGPQFAPAWWQPRRGFLGLTLFLAVFVICFTQLNRVVTPPDGSAPDPVLAHEARAATRRRLAPISLPAWFLSRAYNPMPYVLAGLVAALAFQDAERAPGAPLLPPWPVIVRNSVILAPGMPGRDLYHGVACAPSDPPALQRRGPSPISSDTVTGGADLCARSSPAGWAVR